MSRIEFVVNRAIARLREDRYISKRSIGFSKREEDKNKKPSTVEPLFSSTQSSMEAGISKIDKILLKEGRIVNEKDN